jgi:hypothetical protein
MEKELSLKEIMNDVILFFINFRNIIVITTILGTLSVVLFQKLRPAYFETTAIATSGISVFGRIADDKEFFNQRIAINLINNLQLDIKKSDYVVISEKLNISKENARLIKSISAEQIFNKDQDGKDHNTPKFEIKLSVKDNSIIKSVEEGLLHYFNNNKYISDFYSQYQATNNQEIEALNDEIKALNLLRSDKESNLDMSSFNLYSNKGITEVQNQIIELMQLKSVNSTNLKLLKPLSFVQGFTVSQVPERSVLILGSLAAFVSFILSVIVAIFVNVKQSFKK